MSVRTGVDEYNQPTSDINSGYVGEFKYFGFESVPPHCLACDGSEVSRETYSELFAVFGTTFGAGDGSTTFNLPDLRGQFLRGVGGNSAALGVEQGDAIRNITGAVSSRSVAGGDMYTGEDGAIYKDPPKFEASTALTGSTMLSQQRFHIDASRVVPTAAENRPVNVAVNICVVYE